MKAPSSPLGAPLEFSVVIPAWNLSKQIGGLLDALNEQAGMHDQFECIVVDDASTDGTREVVRGSKVNFTLRLLEQPVNLGRGAARNLGWCAARGAWVVFLDGDMLPAPGLLSSYREAFARGGHDVLSGERWNVRITPGSHVEHRADSSRFGELFAAAQRGQYPTGRSGALEQQLREICQRDCRSVFGAFAFVTSNAAVRRSVLERSGGFEPFLRRFEDTELGIRLWEAGARFGFASGAVALHEYDGGSADRGLSLAELRGSFHRHPYSAVLATYLWLTYQDGPAPTGIEGGPLTFERHPAEAARVVSEFRKRFPGALPGSFDASPETLAAELAERTGLDVSHCRQLVATARARGVHAEPASGGELLDPSTTLNWLRTRSALREAELRQSPVVQFPADLLGAAPYAAMSPLHYELHYELWLTPDDTRHLPGDLHVELTLPGNCDLTSDFVMDASSLGGAGELTGGVLSLPIAALRRPGGVRLEYRFNVGERWGKEPEPAPVTPDLAVIGGRPRRLRMLDTLLQRIGIDRGRSNRQQAHQIYSWIIEHTLPVQTLEDDDFILDAGLGTTSQQAILFAQICCRLGIPARLRRAALLELEHAQGTGAQGAGGKPFRRVLGRTRRGAGFQHRWAQVFTEDAGWIHVDFLAARLQPPSAGSLAVSRAAQRDPAQLGRSLEHDHFGHVDPFRVPLSVMASARPLIVVAGAGEHEAIAYDWNAVLRHRWTGQALAGSQRTSAAEPSVLEPRTPALQMLGTPPC